MEKLEKISIGYAIPKIPLSHPAFRRRAAFYLQNRALKWEIADFKKRYDVVIVHHSADITLWSKYDKGKVILDYNDDYLICEGAGVMDKARGLAKYLSGQWSRLHLDFRDAYAGVAARADAVVCCSRGASKRLAPHCANRHIVMDMQPDADWAPKADYNAGKTFNLVWEGFPGFQGLADIVPSLETFKARRNSALHLITTLRQARFMRNYFSYETKDEVTKKLPLRDVFLYEWNEPLFPKLVNACDLAIIPIDMKSPMWVGKPANKLISFWRLGMPTLTSPTPAYEELMQEAGCDMVCLSRDDWTRKLEAYAGSVELRRAEGRRLREFAEFHFSNEALLSKWDDVLKSVL